MNIEPCPVNEVHICADNTATGAASVEIKGDHIVVQTRQDVRVYQPNGRLWIIPIKGEPYNGETVQRIRSRRTDSLNSSSVPASNPLNGK